MTSLVLSAVMSQRNSDQEALKGAKDELEMRVAERTEQLEGRILEQNRAEAVLHDLSVQLLQVQDAERRRIARALHDRFAQSRICCIHRCSMRRVLSLQFAGTWMDFQNAARLASI
jgi:hypothetical protein